MFTLNSTRRFTPTRFAKRDEDAQPIILMREATLEEWMAWRQVQLEIEQRSTQRHEHRLIEAALTAEQYEEALQFQLDHLKVIGEKALKAAEAAKLLAAQAEQEDPHEPEEEAQGDPEDEATKELEAQRKAEHDAKLKATREHLEAYNATFDPAVDVERMSDLEHTLGLLERVIVGFERVRAGEHELKTWDVDELKSKGLTRRQILMALAGPGREGLTTLLEMGNFAVQGLTPDQKKASTAT
jgi:hypothetical protein